MKADSTKGKVLITGINGFLGTHIAKLLLEYGYTVRGTIRDKCNKEKLSSLDSLSSQNLELYQAHLLDPIALEKAVEGCDYVMHVAAPVVMTGDESLIVKPAVEGTKSIIEAAIKHKIKAIVMTSSIAAIVHFNVSTKKVFNEEDWPNMDQLQIPYVKAKVLSEKAAWEIYNKIPKESRPRLTTINPALILGPTMGKTTFLSGRVIIEMLNGHMKEIPKLSNAIIDVRDVALAHVKALERPESDGQRYICHSGEYFWIKDLAETLKDEFEKYGYKISINVKEECPDKNLESILNKIWGRIFETSNEKIRRDLGIEFIKARQTVIDMGYSMIKQGLVPNLIDKK